MVTITRTKLEQMAEDAARRHNLPASLVKAVCLVESSWRPAATRREPGYRWFFRPETFTTPEHDLEAEKEWQRTSWGLMQIMGACARERGFTGDLSTLTEPMTGLEFGCRHLSWTAGRYLTSSGWKGVISAWNDGRPRIDPGETYWKKIDAALGGVWPSEAGTHPC